MELPIQTQKAFDSFAKTLIEMRNEIVELEKTHGTTARFLLHKRRTYQALAEVYNHLGDVVPKMYVAMRLAALNQEALYIMENKRALGVSWDVAKDLLGVPEPMIKDLKVVDDILARIMLPGHA